MSLQQIIETEARSFIQRDGIEDLLNFLHTSDFYTAPASSRFHGASEGGLAEHSLSVYKWAFDILTGITEWHYDEGLARINPESLAIVSLFHDVCKINTYVVDYRNQKNPETGVWERVPYYRQEDNSGFGCHGMKSAFLINEFMRLTEEEAIAIIHHMGAWDKSNYTDPGKAYEKYPLAWILHVADEAATYISKT